MRNPTPVPNTLRSALLIGACLVGAAGASETRGEENNLPSLIRSHTERTPEAASHLAVLDTRRTELLASCDALNDRLSRTSPTHWPHWKAYFSWEEMRAQIDSPQPDIQLLQEICARFFAGYEGLEHQLFVDFRGELVDYIRIAAIAESSDPVAEYIERLNDLADQFEAAGAYPPSNDEVGPYVAWLYGTRTNPELTEKMKFEYSLPNVVVQVRKKYVLDNLGSLVQDVDESEFKTNVIAGTRVSGMVHMKGTARPQLIEKNGMAALRIEFSGEANAPYNAAREGPLRIFSRGVTQLRAFTDISWNGSAVTATPVQADCQTTTQILGTQVDRARLLQASRGGVVDSLIQNVGRNQIQDTLPTAEADASRIAERELSQQIQETVAPALVEANEQLGEYYFAPLTRSGMLPKLTPRIAENFLNINLHRPDRFGLTAPTDPPQPTSEADITVAFHESSMAGFVHNITGGSRWRDRDFSDVQFQLVGDRSYEMRIGLHPRWSVMLDWWQPMYAKFDDGLVVLHTRANSITIDGETYNQPFEVIAKYKIHLGRVVPEYQRVEDLQVVFANPPTTEEAATRDEIGEFIKTMFSGFFLDDMYLDGITFPAGGQWGGASHLRVIRTTCDNGWLTFEIQDQTPPTEEAAPDESITTASK